MVEPGRLLEMIGGRAGYRRFVQEELKERDREEYYRVEDQRFLGAAGFGEKLKRRAKERRGYAAKEIPECVFRSAAHRVGVEPEVLRGARIGDGRFRERAHW